MRAKRACAFFGIAIFAGGCCGISVNAMRVPRIELLREVRVPGKSVLLSDLLPPGAGDSLRARAEDISLGAAPEPGNTRVLERAGVLVNIGAREDVASAIAVPERIVVSRDARAITVQEVFSAIQAALENSGISAAANLRAEDILLQTQVLVGPGDAGLEVLRSDFDAGLKRGRFLLWPSHDPKVLPFLVTVRFAGNLPLADFHSVRAPRDAASKPDLASGAATIAKAEVLVSPGEQATLLLRSDALRMTADVVSLGRGTMGQRVQVRVVDTGKIFSAQVDGRAHLELKF